MGDAFRGLTIRIGADARPLKSVLGSIQSSAATVNKEFNKLNRALKSNPSDFAAASMRINAMGDQLAHAASKAAVLQAALKKANTQALRYGKGTGIEQAHSNVQRTRLELEGVNTKLQNVNDAMRKWIAKNKDISFNKASKELTKLRKEMYTSEAAAKELKQIIAGLSKTKRMKLFGTEDADEAYESLKRLSAQHTKLETELKKLHKNQALSSIKREAAAAEAELRNLAHATTQAKVEFHEMAATESLAKMTSDARSLDSELDAARASATRMSEIYDKLPKDMGVARAKMRAFAAEQDIIKEKIKAVESVMKELEKSPAFDKQAAKSEKVITALAKAKQEAGEYSAKLAHLRAELRGVANQIRGGISEQGKDFAATKEFSRLRNQVSRLNEEIKETKANSRAADAALEKAATNNAWRKQREELASLNAELAEAKARARGMNVIGNIAKQARTAGYGLYSTITPAIMMAGRYAVQAANDVDAAYRDMRKTVNGTEDQFEHLRDAAIEFSRSHVSTAADILEIESIGGQLGIAADDLEAFGTTVSNLDIATNMETEDIALGLAKMSNIMGFSQKQYDNFADSLVRLGNNEPALESDIMNISTRFAGMAANVGMSTADMLAFATAATATGQKAESAGGSMQRTIGNIEKAVASGGKKVEAFAKVAGMSADEFTKTWKDAENGGPTKVLTAFIKGLAGIKKDGGSVTATLSDLGINSIRDMQLLSGLTNTLDVLDDSLRMSNDAWNGMSTVMGDGSVETAGDAAREASRKAEGFSGQLQIMKNNAMALAVELTDGVTPIVAGLSGLFQNATGALSKMSPEFKTAIVAIAGVAAALGPTAIGLGAIVSAGSSVAQVIGKLPTAWIKVNRQAKLSNGVFKTFGSALSSMSPALSKAEKSMVVLSPAARAAQPAMQKLSTSTMTLGKAMKGLAGSTVGEIGIAALIGLTFGAIQQTLTQYGDYVQLTSDIAKSSESMIERIGTASAKAKGSMVDFSDTLKYTIEGREQQKQYYTELAQSIEELRDKATETYGNNALIDHYAQSIRSLMKAAKEEPLDDSQQAKLKAAVEGYNKAAGDSIQITDAANAVLEDSTGKAIEAASAFAKLARNKKLSAIADYLGEEYAKRYGKVSEAQEKIAEARAKQRRLEERKEQIYKTGRNNTPEGKWELEGINGQIEELDKQIARYDDTLNDLKSDLKDTDDLLAITAKAQDENISTHIDRVLASKSGLDIVAAIDANEASLADFDEVLNSLGEDVQKLSNDQLLQLAESWDGTFASIMPTLQDFGIELGNLNTFQFEDKTFYISDDGTVRDEIGRVTDLKGITVDDKHYLVSSDGSVIDEQGNVFKLDNTDVVDKYFKIDDKNTAKEKQAATKNLSNEIKKMPSSKKVTFSSNAASEYDIVDKLKSKIDGLPLLKTITLSVTAQASSFATNLMNKITGSGGKGGKGKGPQAAGGINPTLLHKVPAFASGGAMNGIVTAPTMTNQGLVGEAGAEAMLRMGSRTAVVPLTNRHYVRPFARAVAAEMGGGTTVVNNYYSVGGVSYSEGTNGAAAIKTFVHEIHTASRRG